MARHFDQDEGARSVPHFEGLEDRLLLTTLRGGEFFIYQNSQNETCRITLVGEREDVVEIFADHAHFGVVDLPGFYNGNPTDTVGWPVPTETVTRQADNTYVWNNRGETYTDADGYQVGITYGSEAEIFAIYVASCSSDTRLTITKLTPPDPARPFTQPGGTEAWYNRVDEWNGVVANLAGIGSYLYASNANPPVVVSSDGGGSILVGARHAPEDDDQLQTRWVGVYGEIDLWGWGWGDGQESQVQQTGVYPGSPPYPGLNAGITISDEIFRLSSGSPLGLDVGGVAADANGNIYAVDSSPFISDIVNESDTGDIGNDIQAIAMDQFGVSYVADHERRIIVVNTGNDRAGNPIAVGTDVRTLTGHDGIFYGVDESTGEFLRIEIGEEPENMGLVADAQNSGQTFTDFIALTTRPGVTSGEIWGLATSSLDGQLSLVRVAVPTGVRDTVDFTRVAVLNTAEDSPWGANVLPQSGLTAAAMRFDTVEGLQIYATTGANQLVRVNPATGEITVAEGDRVAGAVNLANFELRDIDEPANNNSLQTIVGLEFIGETLYAITQDRQLYHVDLSQLDTTSTICTNLGDSMAPFAESLAYDPALPGRFYTVMEDSTILRLGMIAVEGTLVRVAADGRASVMGALWDSTQPTFGFADITGLEFVPEDPADPNNNNEILYGLARIADLDTIGLPAAPEGAWLVTINEGTGEVTRLGRVVGPTALSSVAYNDVDEMFYAVDPTNNQLFVLDPATIDDRGTADDLDDVIDMTGQIAVDVGSGPRSVVSGDINGDTIPDFLVANENDDTVSVFLGDGVGGFTAVAAPDDLIAVGSGPVFLSLTDLTGDTVLDLVVVNQAAGTVSVLTGDGDGTFTARATLTVGTMPTSAAVGLLDNDANPDLVVANEDDSTVSVFLGNGDGTFAANGTVATAGQPSFVVLADVDNNGELDLIASNANNDTVSVLMGDGLGGFVEHQDYGPEAVAVGLLNNDANLDVVTANQNGDTVSVLLGDGNGAFTGRITYAVGDQPVDVLLADINRDGDLDVITVNQGSDDVTYCLGDGAGAFGAPTVVVVGSNPRSISSGNINSGTDSFLDFMVSNRGDNTVTILLGNAVGGLLVGNTYDVGVAPEGVALGDMDDDDVLDAVVANSGDDTVSVLLGNGDGTFAAETPYDIKGDVTLPLQRPMDVALIDVDGNDSLDVITANRSGDSVSVLFGTGGTLSAPLRYLAGRNPGGLTLDDVDGDTVPDIVVTNEIDDTVSVLINEGRGTFLAPGANETYGMGDGPVGGALADLDGDDILDIITGDRISESVSVRLGQGNGTFEDVTSYTLRNWFVTGEAPSGVAVADFDGDGNLDIITSNVGDGTTQSTVSLLLGNGDGTYQAPTDVYVGVDPQFVYVGDLNEDGNWDAFTADAGSHTISARLGNGDGTFGGNLAYPVGLSPTSMVLIDLDGDGHLDLLSANAGDDTVSVILGNGDGSFGGELEIIGNTDPFVGIEWITANNGDQALFGVTASAEGATPGIFDPPESQLYTIEPATGVASFLDNVNRYIVGEDTHIASLTSLTYSDQRPGYLWSTDKLVSYYDSDGNLVSDSFVYIADDGVPHLFDEEGDVLIEDDQGYRLTAIPLSSALIVSDGAGEVNTQTVLFDEDSDHPFWYYDEVYAMDYDPDGHLYAVGKVKSLVPTVDPLDGGGTEETHLVIIDDRVGLVPDVNVVSRIEGPLAVTDVTTISVATSDVIYGVSADAIPYELFLFDLDGTGAVTSIGLLSANIEGMDFESGYVSTVPGYGDGTFGLRSDYAVGTGPYLANLADLNEDGFNDIVTVNELDDSISVILSETVLGALTGFAPQVTYEVGDAPVAAYIAEINRDGFLDIVVVNRGDGTAVGTVTVLFGAGEGSFLAQAAPGEIWVGQLNDDDLDDDIDSDDYLDIVVVNPDSDQIAVLLGSEDGYVDEVMFYSVGTSPQGLSVGQLNDDNGDGAINSLDFLDVVTANNADNTISVLMGEGNGSFLDAVEYDVGYAPIDVIMADLTGDSISDLVVVNNGESFLTVLENDGGGIFTEVSERPDLGYAGFLPTDAALGDLNGDGRLDLTVSLAFGSVAILLGDGDATFTAADPPYVSVGYGVVAVLLGQLTDDNGDGFVNAADNLDLITTNYYDDSVSVLLGSGSGTFGPETRFDVGAYPTSAYLGQLDDDNGDGTVDSSDVVDLVVANEEGDSVSVLLGTPDAAMAATGIYVGDGTFTARVPPTQAVGDGPVSVMLGDTDGDGYLDLITGNYNSETLSVLPGIGDGTFDDSLLPPKEFSVGETGDVYDVGYLPVDIAVGDLNRDLILDLVVVNSNANNEIDEDTVSVLLGNEDGTFQAAVPYTIGDRGTAVALGDMNLDGSPDIIVTNGDGDTISLLQGNGDGTFDPQVVYDVGDNPSDVAIGDITGNGLLDVVVANYDDATVSLLQGRGDGTLSGLDVAAVANSPESLALGDLDDDGILDIVAVSDVGSSASVLMGIGNGVFLGYREYAMASGSRSVVLDDLNGDEVPDIVVANYNPGSMYGISPGQLFTLNPATATLTEVVDGTLSETTDVARGLSSSPQSSKFFWGTGTFGRGTALSDYLMNVFTSEENAIQDMGRIRVSGTVAGIITTEGNIGAVDIGWMWCNVHVGRNLDTVILRAGGAGKIVGINLYRPYQSLATPEPDIHVAGTLNRLETRSGIFYGSVNVDNDADIFPLTRAVMEMETNVATTGSFHYSWLQGEFPHLGAQGWENDTISHAQFINHPTGSMDLYGAVSGETTALLPEEMPGLEGQDWQQDWYALPMEAGQTITMQGWFLTLAGWVPFIASGTTAGGIKAHMYDSDGRWQGSLGYETWDDYGLGSDYRYNTAELIEEQKPMIFTAPAAGVYYLSVLCPPPPSGYQYWIEIDGAAPASLGGARVEGDWLGGSFMNAFIASDATGTELQSWTNDELSATYDDIVVENGGHIGAVIATGRFGGQEGSYTVPMTVHTIGGGDIYSVEGGSMAGASVLSERSIGRVGTLAGDMDGTTIIAGLTPYQTPDPSNPNPEPARPIDPNAFIQNIFTVGNVGAGSTISATGSIGTIGVGGNMLASAIEVNSDEDDAPGRLDLIQVEGDWGQIDPVPIVPVLYRHDDGDIGYVHVGGEVYQNFGEYVGAATPHRKVNGEVSSIWDDSGGMLTITPSQLVDANGVGVVDVDGNPVYTAYSYVTIGVDDFWFPGSGDGGVVVNLTIDGPATFSATGDVKIGDFLLDDNALGMTARNVTIGGPGKLHAYYLNATQDWGNYTNNTGGDIISGMLAGINSIVTGGSIGAKIGALGTWVHGLDDAPVSAAILTEPQYGWYRDKVNGLMINGAVGKITAGGFIRDVRATGRIGPVVANADDMTPAGQWHGVNGIIWSGARIDSVEVGDGLADDGPVGKAQAAIMSAFTIGKVTISGPRFTSDGVVYGEINGAILGYVNEIVDITTTGTAVSGSGSGDLNFPRNAAWVIGSTAAPTPGTVTTTVEWEAVGEIIGTNGAHMTALVGGIAMTSFYCFSSSAIFYQGWQAANPTYSSVGTISFSGSNAKIDGMEVAANYVGEVIVGPGTSGMFNTMISADAARESGLSVRRVAAGGPGMKHVNVGADGGDVGVLEGLDSVSDMQYCDFVVTDGGIHRVSARDIIETTIHAPDDLGALSVGRDFLDVVSAGANTSVQIRPSEGAGDFDSELEQVITSGVSGRAFALGDLNHDGRLDVVTANEFKDDHYVAVTLADEYGYYLDSTYYITDGGPRSVALADLDGDGNLDIITGNYKDDTVSLYFGDGTGLFGDKLKYLVGDKPVSVAVGDVNGDGAPDVITANEGSNNVSVLLGWGNGMFRDQVRYSVGDAPSAVALGQINDDDDSLLDIVVSNRLDNSVSVLLNNGGGTFMAQTTYDVGEFPMHVTLADIDNDGNEDIITANYNAAKISLLAGDGAGAFTDGGTLRTGHNPRYIDTADLDGDGNTDILVANQSDATVSIFMSLGDPGDPSTLADWFDDRDVLLEDVEENPVAVSAELISFDSLPDLVVLSRGELIPGLLVGAIGTFTVGRDVTDSYMKVAGPVGTITVGNRFNNTTLLMPGAAADLRSLDVYGDISGLIESHGQIGTVITRTGGIYADIYTTADEDAPSNDVDAIITQSGYFGRLEIAGSLGALDCYSSLGLDPREEAIPQNFLVAGDLGKLRVLQPRGAAASHLYADISVGGSVSLVDIDGTLFGDVIVHGDLSRMYLSENLGFLDGDGTTYGSLDVLGEIGRMTFSRTGNLVADITTGGSLQKLSIRDGDVIGDITSRYGDILGVTVYNGNILGKITGQSVVSVSLRGKDAGTGDLTGDVTAENGDISKLYVTNGNLLADVSAVNGEVSRLSVSNGNFGSATDKYTAYASRGFRKVDLRGEMYADLETEDTVDVLKLRGNMIGARVSADSGIGSVTVYGSVTDSTVRTGGKLAKFYVTEDVDNSTVSAGWDVGTMTIRGDVTNNSRLLAGWDVGNDTVSLLTGDGSGALADGGTVSAGSEPSSVALGDLDGDGTIDMVVANAESNDVTVRLNRADGTFGPQERYAVGDQPSAVVLGDVDGDGVLDILAANAGDDTLSVLLGEGDGSFADQIVDAVGTNPQDIAVGQLTDDNFDGSINSLDNLDVAVANAGDDTVSMRMNFGAGTFGIRGTITMDDPLAASETVWAVAIGDLDGTDGPELVAAVQTDGTDRVAVVANIGQDGGAMTLFPAPVFYDVGDGPVDVAIGDVDDDDNPDVVVANAGDSTVGLLPGDGAGALGAHDAYVVGTTPQTVALADFTDDGRLDVITANAGTADLSMLVNTGSAVPGGVLDVPVESEIDAAPSDLAVADVNGDGDLDIVVVGQNTLTNPLNDGNAHSGDIAKLYIYGDFNSSIVAAGVDPVDGDWLTADNVPAPGTSSILKIQISGDIENTASSAILADTAIYERFVTQQLETIPGPVLLNYTTDFAPVAVETGDDNDFGRSVLVDGRPDYTWQSGDGLLTITLSGGREGMAYYDELNQTIYLKQTTTSSTLTIRYTGAGDYGTINVLGVGANGVFEGGAGDDGPATDDSALRTLRLIGNVTLGDVNIDGPIRSLLVGEVANGATWNLPGDVSSAKLYQDVTNLTVNAGDVRTWTMYGAYAAGAFQADAVRTFSTRDAVGADIGTSMGDWTSFYSRGDFTGQADIYGDVSKFYVYGSLTNTVNILTGDLRTMYVQDDFTGVLDVVLGYAKSITIVRGDFGGQDDTMITVTSGIGKFYIKSKPVADENEPDGIWTPSFDGLLNSDGDIGTVYAKYADMSGKLRAGGSVTKAYFGSMTQGIAAAGGNFWYLYVYGDMAASSVFAGLDLGYDPNGLMEFNVDLDKETDSASKTVGNTDEARGGSIRNVWIYGDMVPEYNEAMGDWDPFGRGSTIAASVDPGNDGYVGTDDDNVRGAGTVGVVVVYGDIQGNGIQSEDEHQSYGIYAASGMPTVYFHRNRLFQQNGNAGVGTIPPTVGNLSVENARVQSDTTLTVRFSHAVNMGTVNTRQREFSEPTTFLVYASEYPFVDVDGDGQFDADIFGTPLSELTSISDTEANELHWNGSTLVVTMTLIETGISWREVSGGPYFLLVLDGSRIADARGRLLDGDGDGTPGGDYQYLFYRS